MINRINITSAKINLVILFALIPSLIIIGSCKVNTSRIERERIIQQIRQTLEGYHDDIRAKGLTAEFQYLDHSDDFFWIPPGYSSPIPYDSVKAAILNNARLYESVSNTWDTLLVNPINSRYATFAGRFSTVMRDTGGQITRLKLVESGLLVKHNNKWKLLSGQTSVIDY